MAKDAQRMAEIEKYVDDLEDEQQHLRKLWDNRVECAAQATLNSDDEAKENLELSQNL